VSFFRILFDILSLVEQKENVDSDMDFSRAMVSRNRTIPNKFPNTSQTPEAVLKEKRGVWDPIVELTITSPYLIVDSEFQLSTPKMMNADCRQMFPKLFKNGTTNRKMENTRKGKGRVGS
jgi:hypothetical protein